MEYPSMLREVFRRWFGYYPSLGVLLPTMDRGGMPVVTPFRR